MTATAAEALDVSPAEVSARARDVGIAAIVLGKAADALATAHGGPVGEFNPAAAALFDAVGFVPGLLLASAAIVLAVVGMTELAVVLARFLDAGAWWGPVVVRFLGYAPLALLWLSVGVYNLYQLEVVAA